MKGEEGTSGGGGRKGKTDGRGDRGEQTDCCPPSYTGKGEGGNKRLEGGGGGLEGKGGEEVQKGESSYSPVTGCFYPSPQHGEVSGVECCTAVFTVQSCRLCSLFSPAGCVHCSVLQAVFTVQSFRLCSLFSPAGCVHC
jgi:hypothetical protein